MSIRWPWSFCSLGHCWLCSFINEQNFYIAFSYRRLSCSYFCCVYFHLRLGFGSCRHSRRFHFTLRNKTLDFFFNWKFHGIFDTSSPQFSFSFSKSNTKNTYALYKAGMCSIFSHCIGRTFVVTWAVRAFLFHFCRDCFKRFHLRCTSVNANKIACYVFYISKKWFEMATFWYSRNSKVLCRRNLRFTRTLRYTQRLYDRAYTNEVIDFPLQNKAFIEWNKKLWKFLLDLFVLKIRNSKMNTSDLMENFHSNWKICGLNDRPIYLMQVKIQKSMPKVPNLHSVEMSFSSN